MERHENDLSGARRLGDEDDTSPLGREREALGHERETAGHPRDRVAHETEGTAERAAEVVEHKHPARPEQPDSSFAEGVDHKPDPPEEQLEPDFARGIRTGPEVEVEHRNRFSEGIEQIPTSE